MPENPNGAPAYPAARAFVVQLADPAPAGTDLAGRVEHVVSGRAGHFGSSVELVRFVGCVLRGGGDHEA